MCVIICDEFIKRRIDNLNLQFAYSILPAFAIILSDISRALIFLLTYECLRPKLNNLICERILNQMANGHFAVLQPSQLLFDSANPKNICTQAIHANQLDFAGTAAGTPNRLVGIGWRRNYSKFTNISFARLFIN